MRPQPIQPHIDDPMAILAACHDKVRHFCQLARRLRDHVLVHGADAQARDAAIAIRRYFTVAAPLHHQDEDIDLYPALQALGSPTLTARIDALTAEHHVLHQHWLMLLPWLDALADQAATRPAMPDIDGFARLYEAHAQAEEQDVYPHASQLSPDTMARLAQAMSARRR